MGIKVKDIASMLSLSSATVSLVLNNKPGISDATRNRVIEAVKELGYESILPSEEESRSILFVVYRKHGIEPASTPYFSQLFSEIIEGVESQIKLRGFNLRITYVDDSSILEETRGIVKDNIAGVIVLATEMSEAQVHIFLKMDVPVVILDNYLEQEEADCITINNEQGVQSAITHFVNHGHRKIGYLHVSENANNFTERYFGFYRAMNICKQDVKKEYIIEIATDGGEAVYQQLKEKLERLPELPTAFFADNDIVAICAMRVFRELGYRVPEDISIIGFDNMVLSEMLDPPLTTIQISKHNLGSIAVNTVVEKINDNTVQRAMKIEVGTKLIVRKSVADISPE